MEKTWWHSTPPSRDVLIRVGQAAPGDLLVVVGRPKVGTEVRLDDPEVADVPAALALLAHPAVHGLVTAGSGGILPECLVLAAEAGCTAVLDEPDSPLLRRSAGPATCLVAAVDPAAAGALAALVHQPVWAVGRLTAVPSATSLDQISRSSSGPAWGRSSRASS